MADEGFHEIQLNGKQLVFLFMAATIVAVVIFLCGVMVGRGVPTQLAGSAPGTLGQAAVDPTAAAQQPSSPLPVASTGSASATGQETLTYPTLLGDPNPPEETLTPPIETAAPVAAPAAVALRPAPAPVPAVVKSAPVALRPAAVPPPVVAKAAPAAPRPAVALARPIAAPVAPAATAAADVTLSEPAGSGFVVQVAAVRQRAEANTIARRLGTKGYPAFVTTAGANFRVRVGKYTDRREAESIAGRLEKEEQFKPWITR